ARLREVRERVDRAAALVRAPAVREMVAAAAPLAQRYAAELDEAMAARQRLLALRDGRFFPAQAEFDQRFDAVLNNLAFEVPSAETQALLRERLMAYQGAVNEIRTALQRFLATEEVAQNRRAKRAAAQARVHGRGLRAGAMSDQFGQDLERLLAQGEVIAAAAQDLMTAMDEAAALRADRVVPARAALESAMARASERVAGSVAQGMAATQAAIEDVRNEALLAAAATVLMLLLA
ncbi:methyl-accepting chemotaxis protein, partial [Roseomonas ludipueritiae]|nr:methyl-accepting chemotaxis protein [Pseudoroseomonas ludipueritiae]